MLLPNASRIRRTISIEGNIGCGKSTVMQTLQQAIASSSPGAVDVEYVFLDEPVSEWRVKSFRNGTKSILKLFYEAVKAGDKQMAFVFQVNAFTTRQTIFLHAAEKLSNGSADDGSGAVVDFISERSMLSDKLFAENLFDLGDFSEVEIDVYRKFHQLMTKTTTDKQEVIIYLDVDYTTCHQRLLKRGRDEEQTVPPEYLRALQNKHEEMLKTFSGKIIRVPWVDSPEGSEERQKIISDIIHQLSTL